MKSDQVEEALLLSGEQAAAILADMPEGQWFERKSGRIAARDLAVPLVAMANAEGGYIAIGLNSGKAEPLSPSRINDLRQVAVDFTSPPVRCTFHEVALADGSIAVIEVEPGRTLYETASGEAYLRVGDESRKLTFAQRRELAYDRGSEVFSATVLGNSTVDDLDHDAVRAYQQVIGASTIESLFAARDLIDSHGHLRVAAWLMFAKRPNVGFPNAHVRVLQYNTPERGVGGSLNIIAGHDIRCEGTIPQQIDAAAGIIDQWMPQRNALAITGKFEDQPMIPRDVWLEGLVNAVIHRSYSFSGDHIRFEIFPNRIEISSPGRFPSLADPNNPQLIMRYARNPRIARACAELGYAHELGEGIRRMFAQMREHGLAEPVYVQTSQSVILTLMANSSIGTRNLPKNTAIVLDLMRQAGVPLKTGEIAEMVGVTRPTALRHLRALQQENLVVWQGDSLNDPGATWSIG